MSILKPILGIIPSIANVVGSLFGANSNDYVRFRVHLPSSGTNEEEEMNGVYFFQRNGQIWAGSNNKESVQISFPSENGAFGDSYVLQCRDQFPINTAIHSHAVANVDNFEITAGGDIPATNGLYSATISASGKVDRNSETPVQISSDISIGISGNDLTVMVQEHYTLDRIPLLVISGEGNEPQRKYQNIQAGEPIPVSSKMADGSNQITFPDAIAPYVYSNYIMVNVSVNCSYDGKSEKVATLRTRQGIIRGTDADWEFLKTGKCLNR